jgi:hypothetical protein
MNKNNTPRAKTKEEVRKEFLVKIHGIVNYWANLLDETVLDRCDGVAFSILNIFDGTSVDLPAMNISLYPHPDDMLFDQNNGENWYEPGMIINDCYLHEEYYK